MSSSRIRRPERLFVYGTLRMRGASGELLRDCHRIRSASLRGTLHHLGPYPALILDGEGMVRGEVWSCPPETLRALDAYEGVEAGLFERVRVQFEEGPCWTYVAGPRLKPRLKRAPVIHSGDWLRG